LPKSEDGTGDASNESGVNQHRLSIPDVYTAIWWYADHPNHYAGDGEITAV
jgi:creatinine amidohydrolase